MKRSHVLIILVGLALATAVGLRVCSQFNHSPVVPVSSLATGSRPISIPEPRDYVANPSVSPDETDHGPKRIISLAPSITEIVCALGMRDRLLGRTPYCSHPPGIEAVPAVGAMMDTNYARIKALEPDLILTTSNSGSVITNLGKLGLRGEVVPHETLEEVFTAIERIGRLCDRPRTAGALVAAIRGDLEELQGYVTRTRVHSRRLLIVFGPLPVPPKAVFVAGPGLFLDRLVELAGQRNAARDLLKSSQGEIPLELLRVIDPEVILQFQGQPTAEGMTDLYRSWSEVGELQAIRRRRVGTIGGPEWLSAGPRIAIELHRLITVLSEVE